MWRAVNNVWGFVNRFGSASYGPIVEETQHLVTAATPLIAATICAFSDPAQIPHIAPPEN